MNGDLHAELASARWLLRQLSMHDLETLEFASPPIGFWSRVLVRLVRAERLRRQELEWRLEDLVALAPTGTDG